MQPGRTLAQIISEIDSVYAPQVQSIRDRQGLIPQQIADEEKGLEAKQQNAFGDILGGARRRGLGFSGIPLGEQAKYTASEFLPAVARLRQSGREQAMSLEDAILGINERRQGQALGIQQYENQRYDTWKAQQEQLAESRRQAAAAAARPTYGSMGAAGGAPAPDNEIKVRAMADVDQLLVRRNSKDFYNEIQAIAKSAGYGNTYDQAKLELLQAKQPGLFRNGVLDTGRINRIINSQVNSIEEILRTLR